MEGVMEKKLPKFYIDIHESNHALKYFIESNSNRNLINISVLPCLLTKKQSDALQEVIKKNKISNRICCKYKHSSIKARLFWTRVENT